ncbi:MAG: PAS domain S-box protein [Actinobacteria bacterium]|nr:PAS domain S-box protein [Actinomycetota bacterium]MBW3650812.1 PAS domain S-box protein [Actinomycetota bacterium]
MTSIDRPRARRLPPEPASAGRARRFVSEVLGEWHLEVMTEVASLLVSEVVTNAVLHAGTEVTVQLRRSPEDVRVEVADGSTQSATRRHYDREASTGRGLALVEALSDDWGVDADGSGKTVWFAMRVDQDGPARPASARESSHAGDDGSRRPAAGERQVLLRNVPFKLILATAQLGDSILREAALLALSGDEVMGEPSRWQAPAFDMTRVLGPVEEALASGKEVGDVTFRFPVEACEAALQRLALIEEAERLTGEGLLLSLPSLPEVAAFRRWYLGEIARQLQGSEPSQWQLPETGQHRPEVVLADHDRAQLVAMAGAVIAADDTNHILYVSDSAGELLGWPPEELTGKRLTVIVPPELREAHLAGYTRFQVTGETGIIGVPVRVAAFRHDGTRVQVELTIDLLPRKRGAAFVARLRPLQPASALQPEQ